MMATHEQQLVNRLTLLLEINASINSTVNLSELLQKIINVAAIVVSAEASSLALVDAPANELIFQFAHGNAEDHVKSLRVPIGEGISGWVARYGVSVLIEDAQNDPRFLRKVDDKTQFITRSVLCVPLKRNQVITGVLQALNKRDGGVFTEEDQLIFEALANIATIAIENAQLYGTLQQKMQELEDARRRSDSVLNQLQQSEREIAQMRSMSSPGGTLAGNLAVFRLENLVQMLSNDYKTGCLRLTGEIETGAIYFDQGKLVHAEVPQYGLKGDMALYDMMCWREGSFSFVDSEAAPQQTCKGMAMALVIEGLRRLDEYNVLKEKISLDAMPHQVNFSNDGQFSNTAKANIALDHRKIALLQLIDGQRTVRDILDKAHLDRFSVLSALSELNSAGLVTIS
jgi:putative methionine-R-sulfoxide reductase with GAF domain